MAVVRGLTIREFEQLPDALALNHELLDGELVDVSGNTTNHIRLQFLVGRRMADYVEEQKLGIVLIEQEYEFEENAHGPDISFFGPEKMKLLDGDRRVQLFVPGLAIEIVSRSERFEALIEKVLRYRRCGVGEAYIFSMAARQVFTYSDQPTTVLSERDEFRPRQIPGFSIRIADLFGTM